MKIGLRTKLQDQNENFVGKVQQIEDGFFVDAFVDGFFVDIFDDGFFVDAFDDVFDDAFRRVLVATVVVVGQRPETNSKIVFITPDFDSTVTKSIYLMSLKSLFSIKQKLIAISFSLFHHPL